MALTNSSGGAAQTVDGTIVGLRQSGTLIVGSSTIPLLGPHAPLTPFLTIDSLTVEAESSLAIADGVTLSRGVVGVTVYGSVVR